MKKVIGYIAVVVIVIVTLFILIHKYNQTMDENERLKNNIEYYQGSENIALRYTIKELNNTKDSLIQELLKARDSLGLKSKQTKEIIYTKQVIRDTVVTEIPFTFNFHETVILNDLTSIEVWREDSILTLIPDIQNEQLLFIQSEPVYKYKNFFSRLIHFNFKKTITYKYYIDNSNSLIDVCESVIVEVDG